MMSEPFASDPFVVGKSAPSAEPPHISAEESLCPVVSHDWVNSEYKHLVVEASSKALTVTPGQFFNLLCPSPDVGELFFRRPQSVYRVNRKRGRIEFLYKCVGRGTRGLSLLEKGDALNMVGPLGVGFRLDPAWRHIVVLGRGVGIATLGPISQLARDNNVGVTAILSARDADFIMADTFFREAGDVVSVLDTDGSSAVENVEKILGQSDRAKPRRCVLHLRLKPPVSADEAARQGPQHRRPSGDGAGDGVRARPLLRLCPHLRRERQEGTAPGLHRRAGVRHAGGGRMVEAIAW